MIDLIAIRDAATAAIARLNEAVSIIRRRVTS